MTAFTLRWQLTGTANLSLLTSASYAKWAKDPGARFAVR
jgi:hypothetical protein